MNIIKQESNMEATMTVYETDNIEEITNYLKENRNIETYYLTENKEIVAGKIYRIIEYINDCDRSTITIKERSEL